MALAYTTPLIVFLKEFYKMLSESSDELGFDVYDSGTDVSELLAEFETMANVEFGIVCDVSCVPTVLKYDTVTYHTEVTVNLLSTYSGRIKIGEMIDSLIETVTKYTDIFKGNLNGQGYDVIRLNIKNTTMGNSTNDGGVIWQNGSVTFSYELNKIDS